MELVSVVCLKGAKLHATCILILFNSYYNSLE